MEKNKRKGGAEKIREKKKKKLEDEAKTCKNIGEMFSQVVQMSISSSTKFQEPIPGTSIEKDSDNERAEAGTSDVQFESSASNFVPEITSSVPRLLVFPIDQVDQEIKSKKREPKPDEDDDLSENEEPEEQTYFNKSDKDTNLTLFFKFHPKQPMHNVPFNPITAYFRKENENGSETIKRQWLSYSSVGKKLFCTFCLAFSKEDNRFTKGCGTSAIKNPYERLKEHERALVHHKCAEAYLLWSRKKDVIGVLRTKRNDDIKKRRAVLERIIDTIKLIGKRGLSYRGAKEAEAAYTLSNPKLDHGNFLEIILLLAKYDPQLENHIQGCITTSTKHHNKRNDGHSHAGRPGSFTTFLSKTTVNYVIESLLKLMKNRISEQILKSGMFSIQIDSTQDINVHDQLCVILRYVTDTVNERLIAVEHCKSGTGHNLSDLVSNLLRRHRIDITKCIGSSTDGASNMRGQYNGFSAWLTKTVPEQTHVWCYAHILNLVMSDTTQVCTEAVNLFGVMNSCANFVRESYVRMAVWEEKSNFKFINSIGETRWWAKDKCLFKIFGPYGMPEKSMFIELLETLQEISISETFNADARYKASTILDKFQNFGILLTAHIFLRIFSCTTPLSLYLQTKGLNLLKAYQMVEKTLQTLKQQSRDFETTLEKSKRFVTWANNKFLEKDVEITIDDKFSEKRIPRKKQMAGEKSRDEPIANLVEKFKVTVYNVIYDRVITSMESRFVANEKLFKDIAWLDPNSFNDVVDVGEKMPRTAFKFLASKIKEYVSIEIDEHIIQSELKDFASKWDTLKTIISDSNSEVEVVDVDEHDGNTNSKIECTGTCQNCVICCFSVLTKYRLHTLAYSNLYWVYKYLLTLSCTQVRCETTFSKLKYILNRLRNCLSQEHLEAFLFMSVEKDILIDLENNEIIDEVAQRSSSLKNLLLF